MSKLPPHFPFLGHYLLQEQIRAYVYDVVRATLPRMFLDEAFEAKDDIAHAVKASLQTCMGTYGYSILVSV
jgi:regulator of protease activity HflC (stomatin/prohibitin superfamily)